MLDILKFEVIDQTGILKFFGVDEQYSGIYIEIEVLCCEQKSFYQIHLLDVFGTFIGRSFKNVDELRECINLMRKAVVVYGPFLLV